jgi:hypothetical protein
MDIERQNYLNECAEEDNRKIKEFIEKFGQTDDELAELEGIDNDDSLSEMGINLGYIWSAKFQRWINKNNSFYTKEDERIIDILKQMN